MLKPTRLLLPSFHNFILSVYCDLFMGFSERVNVQCSIGKIKTAGKPGGARLSTVGVPLSLPCLTNIISMQMIWAQQVKIMQYHIFCATPGLSNESVPREGRDANARERAEGRARGHWAKWAHPDNEDLVPSLFVILRSFHHQSLGTIFRITYLK